MMQSFDLIVIGSGPGGYLGAERAAKAGLKTAVIEKRKLGGVCLNEGCIPSKAFLHSAKVYEYALHGEGYGVSVTGASIDHAKVVARKNNVVDMLVGGLGSTMNKLGITVISGEAKILGKDENGFTVQVGAEKYAAKKLLIASGSVPVTPPIPGVKEGLASGFVLTNREILDLKEAPKELVVIGGGVIGLEMASYFNSIGSRVTVIEMLDKIAGPTDGEISNLLLKSYKAKGVEFKLNTKVESIADLKADKVLLSIGRRAFTEGLGLENIGVHTERGAIVTDENSRTNISGVYAAGDVNGKSMLAHTAYREAEVAVNHMLGKRDKMRHDAIPSVIYTNPEVASVGETEETAKAKKLDYKVVKLNMSYSGRYLAETEKPEGIVKVLLDKQYGRVLGVHMLGSYASEIIFGAAMMLETDMRAADVQNIVFPHPTVAELLREAMFEL
jgi:dihydrolipoamide dehydrogenase